VNDGNALLNLFSLGFKIEEFMKNGKLFLENKIPGALPDAED
jgi:hypothetical protein